MSLTKAELANSLCETLGLSKSDAKELVDNFFNEISLILQSGETIKISGFGNFELKDKNARPGRNPKTGEEVMIAPRRVVTFKQGQKLRAIMANVNLDPNNIEKEKSDSEE
jgi:integration host factor subunit alpha